MPPATPRADLLAAAIAVFLRYGYKKTSMDDVARAAGISRQGLYLHFPSKELLFGEAATCLAAELLTRMRAALAEPGRPVQQRLVDAFTALRPEAGDSAHSLEHMAEIVATARQLVGPVLQQFDQDLLDALAQALEDGGIAARWAPQGIHARALAAHLLAASHGLKHQAPTAAEYQAGMRVAVQLVCGA